MSYGYEPPKQEQPGSWAEVFAITKVVFSIILPFLGAMFGFVLLITVMVLLFAQHPALALLPLIPVAAVIVWVLRRERREHDEEVARIQRG